MKAFEITSADSVNDFLFEICYRYDNQLDPAADLRTLYDKNGIPVFSKQEAEYLDNVMMECFRFCIFNNLDIDRISNSVQSQANAIRAVA